MRVAIVHEFLTTWGGSDYMMEKVHDIFPEAPIFTAVYNDKTMPERFRDYDIRTSFIQKLPLSRRKHQLFMPLFPMAFESFDLSGFDVVISVHHSCAKGVITRPETLHVCICCSPMRYAWDLYHEYMRLEKVGAFSRLAIPVIMNYIRNWDLVTASRVDEFLAISKNVAKRIWKHYRRDSAVLYPPVETERFGSSARGGGEHYLMVSRLVAYKRADLVVDAFNANGRPLVIVGAGGQYKSLARKARSNIRFLGHVANEELAQAYARSKAFLFPQEEDFGITAVEAQAAGKPVIAYRAGGALETVKEDITGVFFDRQDADSINMAVERFEQSHYNEELVRANAARFDVSVFKKRLREFVETRLEAHNQRMNSCGETDWK